MTDRRFRNLTFEEFCDLFESHVVASEFAGASFPHALLLEAVSRHDEMLIRFEDITRIAQGVK